MKNTKYFDTIEEAKRYYSSGVPSNVIAIVGDGSQVLVSSDNAADNANQQYFNADLTNDEIVSTMVQTSYNQGFSYGESVTYPIAYEAGYSYGYDIGETAGYDTGYAAGQAAGGANWLDVLYLDEKAKAETALNVTEWSDSQKYNFANDAANDGSCVNPQTAPALIAGVLQDATISKVIKISKDQNDNAVITYHNCYINFDGTNLGAIALDGVTYYSKMCIWSEPLTLAVDDEIIMDVAASLSGTSMFLFGGYDPNAYEMVEEEGQTYKQWKAATYKCTTAGTYTFGMTIDLPTAQNPQAIAFVSTMFNYEGSATVPAIAVPTGETSGGGGSVSLTEEQLNQMSFGLTMQSIMQTGIDTPQLWQIDIDYMDTAFVTTAMNSSTGMMVDIYNETSGLVEDYSFTFTGDDTDNYISAVVSLTAGDKVGFTLCPMSTDPGTGNNVLDGTAAWLYRYVDPNNDGTGYNTHFYEADNTGDYEFKIQLITDDETGDWRIDSITFTEVVQP